LTFDPKDGVKGFQALEQKIKNKKKHTYPLLSLQFSQEEGLILIHSEYFKKVNYYFTLKYTILFIVKFGMFLNRGMGNINSVPKKKKQI